MSPGIRLVFERVLDNQCFVLCRYRITNNPTEIGRSDILADSLHRTGDAAGLVTELVTFDQQEPHFLGASTAVGRIVVRLMTE